ncbi:MAG: YbaB/EbfC family nucleoid-associated protein [Oscillospiraceae bacterium]|jgi:DNA-binding YbaB/EbfC family protein|nr:YbaB/EbfC family nucleoid-associated protein [Oscillospiraceae bacterium]
MKARLPKGYGGGPQDMNTMIKQAQKMQELMEEKKAELDERVFDASAGGGAVRVTVKGSKELVSVKISPDAADPGDVEMLEDLIMAAVNEALRAAEEAAAREMGAITGGVGIPSGF